MAPSPSAANLLFAAGIALSRQPWLCLGGPNYPENADFHPQWYPPEENGGFH